MAKKDFVTITCYGKKETMPRQQAIAKYREGYMVCDGSERERYAAIYFQLIEGKAECYDNKFC